MQIADNELDPDSDNLQKSNTAFKNIGKITLHTALLFEL